MPFTRPSFTNRASSCSLTTNDSVVFFAGADFLSAFDGTAFTGATLLGFDATGLIISFVLAADFLGVTFSVFLVEGMEPNFFCGTCLDEADGRCGVDGFAGFASGFLMLVDFLETFADDCDVFALPGSGFFGANFLVATFFATGFDFTAADFFGADLVFTTDFFATAFALDFMADFATGFFAASFFATGFDFAADFFCGFLVAITSPRIAWVCAIEV